MEKSLEIQKKTIEDASKKQTNANKDFARVEKQVLITDQRSISDLFSKYFLATEVRDKINKSTEIKQKINKNYLIYKTGNIKG